LNSHALRAFSNALNTANKAGELNDYSVCTTWGILDRKYFYLLNVYRRRRDFPGLKKAVKQQAALYYPTRFSWKTKPQARN
jgi:phage terminase large subunit-like protein